MDFFEHQDRARRMTWRLVGLLLAAMTLVILAVYGAAVLLEGMWHSGQRGLTLLWVQPRLFGLVALGTTALVGAAAWIRTRSLDAGGGAVALSMGARQVLPTSAEGRERVLLNVVEEMAIASGLPVPFVFVLDGEPGINAFAAAATPEDAAVVLTEGALAHLDRDELQGVVGHEFSHLLNGDTRLNMRLVGLLYGLSVLGQAGLLLLRVGSGPRHRVGSRRGGGAWPLMAFGAILWLAGSVGRLAARVIKAALSRQREYLADAASVQFSRNPRGLVGALKKVGGLGTQPDVQAPGAEEFSHLFFCEAFEHSWLAGLFATHPPLHDRIRRMEPGFRGDFPAMVALPAPTPTPLGAPPPRGAGAADPLAVAAFSALDDVPVRAATRPAGGGAGQRFDLEAASVVGRVGAPDAADMRWGGEALQAMPEALRRASAEPFDALALLFALLLHEEPEARARQEAVLARLGPAGIADHAHGLRVHAAALDPRLRLPLVETLVPALRRLSERQRRAVMACVDGLAEADGERSVFEYALRRMLLRRLLDNLGGQTSLRPQVLSARPLAAACSTVLSALAWAGHDEPKLVGAAFRQARDRLPPALRAHTALLESERCTFSSVDEALDRLAGAVPHAKRAFVDACAHCVAADGRVSVEEAELLRTVAEAVRCPIPPLVPRFEAPAGPVVAAGGNP